MEVQVKLRLRTCSLTRSSPAFSLFSSPEPTSKIDDANSKLTSNLTVLCLHFYDLNSQRIVSLKAKPVISSGLSRVEEDEELINPTIGLACMAVIG